MSILIVAKVATPASEGPFRTWMQEEFAAEFGKHLASLTVTLAICDAKGAYDALVEGDCDSTAVLERLRERLTQHGAVMTCYAVERLVEKTPPTPHADAVKMVACIQQLPDLPLFEVRRRWDAHVPLALRIHIGAARYVRNWVNELLLTSAPSPPHYCGIATMSFRTTEDLQDRQYDRPQNQQVILDDVARFMARADSFVGQETTIGW